MEPRKAPGLDGTETEINLPALCGCVTIVGMLLAATAVIVGLVAIIKSAIEFIVR